MGQTAWTRYLVSCGLLTLPILVWNVARTGHLPPLLSSSAFNRDIPPFLLDSENALRIGVTVLPFLMPLNVTTALQRRGLRLFVAGGLLYALRRAIRPPGRTQNATGRRAAGAATSRSRSESRSCRSDRTGVRGTVLREMQSAPTAIESSARPWRCPRRP